MSIKDAAIWDLLDEYADIRDELEDTLQSFEILQFEMVSAMEDIQDEMEVINDKNHGNGVSLGCIKVVKIRGSLTSDI